VSVNTDCNDGDASVHAPVTYYKDNDGDGFGNVNIRCNGQKVGYFIVNCFKWTKSRLFIFPFSAFS
jgi:hypothetical protein